MSGSATSFGGQHASGAQSPAVSHPALNEKSTLESCGSKPSGGSAVDGFAIRENVYVEKSPAESRPTVIVRGESAVAAAIFTGCTCASAPPPVIVICDVVNVTL